MEDAIILVPILVPIAFFAFLAAVILVPLWLSHRSRTASLAVISDAIGKGHMLDAGVVDRLLTRPQPAVGKWYAIICLLFGAPLLGLGIALSLSGIFLADGSTGAGLMVGGMINLSLGSGLTTLGLVSLRLLLGRDKPAPRWDFATALALVCLFFGVTGISMGVGLTLGTQFYGAVDPSGQSRAGMAIGALVNACSGLALAALGVFILRMFGGASDDGQER